MRSTPPCRRGISIQPAAECFVQVVACDWLKYISRNTLEQHKRCRYAPLDPLLGLDFRNVLGDAVCDERGLARRLSRLTRGRARHRVRPELVHCCEHLPELPSVQGWVEAMTSLGRLIFFDQPGTWSFRSCRRRARCQPWSNGPTASPRCSTLSGAAERLWSRASARSRRRRCSPRHIRPAPPRSSCLRDTPIRYAERTETGPSPREISAAMVAMWGTGEFQHVFNPDMPWNEEIRAAWARHERLAASPRTVALMLPLVSGSGRAARCFRQSACQLSSSTTPTSNRPARDGQGRR